MSITIETDLAEILVKIDRKLDRIQEDVTDLKIGQTKLEGKIESLDQRLTGKIESLDQRLTGKIESLDLKLTGQINTLDEKFTGQIKTLDAKVDGLSARVQNQDLISKTVLGGLILIILGGGISMFAGFVPLK
jgi:chromosome segregation ATPase